MQKSKYLAHLYSRYKKSSKSYPMRHKYMQYASPVNSRNLSYLTCGRQSTNCTTRWMLPATLYTSQIPVPKIIVIFTFLVTSNKKLSYMLRAGGEVETVRVICREKFPLKRDFHETPYHA